MDCLLGIDFGTTNVKCVAYDRSGNVLARAAASTPVTQTGEGEASYEPDKVWGAVAGLLRETIHALPAACHVAGVAVASVGESVVPLDKDGNAIAPALAWFDTRPREIASAYSTGDSAAAIRRVTGILPDHTFSAFKAMWFKRAHPDLYGRVTAWLPMADYIAFRLSGQRAVSLSLASRTLLMDLSRCAWSDDLFNLYDLDRSQWPDLAPGGTRLGGVTASAVRETSLPESAVVAVGGHDHLCGALAAGATEPGIILDSIGTTEAILAPLLRPLVDETLSLAGFSAGCHAARDRYYVIAGIPASGGLCAWLRRTLFGHIEKDEEAYRLLELAAASSAPGANGVSIRPSFATAMPCSHHSPSAAALPPSPFLVKGVIGGLTTESTPGDIARAALEALSGEFTRILGLLADHTGHPVSRILVTGGGAGNALWRQIKAEMTGRQLSAPKITEAGCLGAAMLAGIAAGIYANEQEAQQHLNPEISEY